MTPREKAEACFAKARSTTSTHERDNAVTVGTRLAEKAGLSLDLFDIPGRVRKAPPRPTMTGDWTYLSGAELDAMLAAMVATLNAETFNRRPRYCPHGSDMALFGDSCVFCERERRA